MRKNNHKIKVIKWLKMHNTVKVLRRNAQRWRETVQVMLRLWFDGRWELLVVSSQDALVRSEQGDPAAALQGLSTLINHHPIKMLRRQELQRTVITGSCRHKQLLAVCPSPSLLQLEDWLYWPVLVDSTTSALFRIWVMAVASLVFSSFLSSPISRL